MLDVIVAAVIAATGLFVLTLAAVTQSRPVTRPEELRGGRRTTRRVGRARPVLEAEPTTDLNEVTGLVSPDNRFNGST